MSLPPPPPSGSHSVPPPPGGDIPAPEAEFISIPPPAPEAEQHESDLLKRRKHFSWKKFGGEGFLVSVALHVILLILGLFWIVNKWREPAKKVEETFASGAGGGSAGDKAKQFEHKMQRKQPMIVKTPSRIVSKSSSSSVSLPSAPTTSTASFASGLSAGGMSKGSGGGSGGGAGTGIGIGVGGGKNFVSLFGMRGKNQKVAGLPGVFFDCKQTPKGKATEYEPGESVWNFYAQVLTDIALKWNQSELDRKFFRAPEELIATQIFIPKCPADSAPAAYGVQDKVKPSRWVAWYRGQVTAPKSGKFRFWSEADDFVSIRWNRKTVIAAKWSTGHDAKFKDLVRYPTVQKGALVFHAGPWLTVEKGRQYPLEVVISEIPGGSFQAQVLMEEYDESKHDGDGKIFLFRMAEEGLPEGVKDGTGMDVDLTGKGLIWTATGDKGASGPVR